LGWPTRSRALALTAFTVEKVFFLARFFGIFIAPARGSLDLCVGRLQIDRVCRRLGGQRGAAIVLQSSIPGGVDVKYFH
jgi:hypothetical protein